MNTKERKERSRYRVHCPHCRTRAAVRSSRRISDTTLDLLVECPNATCGHSFAAFAEVQVTISHTIRPSLMPRGEVTLRHAPIRHRVRADDPPTPANDALPEEVPRTAAND